MIRIIGNLVFFIISLFLLGIGVGLARFALLNGFFDVFSNETGIMGALAGTGFSMVAVIVAGSILLIGIGLAIVTIKLAKPKKTEENQQNTSHKVLVYIEITIYIIWILAYLILGA